MLFLHKRHKTGLIQTFLPNDTPALSRDFFADGISADLFTEKPVAPEKMMPNDGIGDEFCGLFGKK